MTRNRLFCCSIFLSFDFSKDEKTILKEIESHVVDTSWFSNSFSGLFIQFWVTKSKKKKQHKLALMISRLFMKKFEPFPLLFLLFCLMQSQNFAKFFIFPCKFHTLTWETIEFFYKVFWWNNLDAFCVKFFSKLCKIQY